MITLSSPATVLFVSQRTGRWIVYVGLLFLCFGPVLSLGPLSFPTGRTAYLVFSALGFLTILRQRRTVQSLDILIVILALCVALYLISVFHLLHSVFVLNYAIAGVLNFAAVGYLYQLGLQYGTKGDFIASLFFVGVFHAAIMVLTLFVPPFRELLYSVVQVSPLAEKVLGYNLRTSGLMYSSFSILSTIMCLFVALGLLYTKEITDRLPHKVFYYIFLAILMASILVSGRTGLVGLLILATLLFLHNRVNGRPLRIDPILLRMGAIMVVVAIIAVSSIDLSRYKEFFSWSVELFVNFFIKGKLETQSTTILLDGQFFLPTDPLALIFGTGESWSEVHSDVGFVQVIFEVGLLGLGLFLMTLSLFFFKTVRHTGWRSRESMFMTFYFIMVGIGNFKDLYFFFLNGFTVVLFAVYFYVFLQGRNASQ